MADYANMNEQAKRAAQGRDRAPTPGEKRMLDSQKVFYEAMAESEPKNRNGQTKR